MSMTVLLVFSVYNMYIIYCLFDDGVIAVRIFNSSLGSYSQSNFIFFFKTAIPAIYIFSRHKPGKFVSVVDNPIQKNSGIKW